MKYVIKGGLTHAHVERFSERSFSACTQRGVGEALG